MLGKISKKLSKEEDEEPLLSEEKPLHKTPSNDIKRLFEQQKRRKNKSENFDEIVSASDLETSPSSVSLSIFQEAIKDDIIAVFVVTFDTRSGNLLEWSIPEDVDLDGVEFKAMPSGAHTIMTDFIYFRKGHFHGLSCYEKMPVSSAIERGARMKSVGILASSYTSLHSHMPFLELQVRHQLETPGNYDQLLAFYNDKKGILNSSNQSLTDDELINPTISPITKIPMNSSLSNVPNMMITHPAGCFSQFFRFFGKSIFALWKMVLLHKRMLFFSPPPVGVICYRVYCACCLGRHNFTNLSKNAKPYFYVNIADICDLESELSYIACTTEKVFEEKGQLYDIYIDQQNIKTSDSKLKEIIKLNSCDEEKYHQLLNHRQEYLYMKQFDEAEYDDEEQMFIGFFTEQNNRIFQTISDISESSERTLTAEHMQAMGFDPKHDRQFVMSLLELHAIDVTMIIDNPCCPK